MPLPRAVPVALLVVLVLAPLLAPAGTARHVETPYAAQYTAQGLISARWDVGAIEERFLGRPFWTEPVIGRGVRVAVIDTGIDPAHPDLKGRIVAWYDFLHGRPEPYDDDTHGTHVAGIIAAHGHFQPRPDRHYFPFGARGVAPGVELLVAKTMDREGDGDARDVARAVLWALDPNGDGDYSDGANVINLSIGLEVPPSDDGGGRLPDPITLPGLRPRTQEEVRVVGDAIRTAVRAGAVVIAAAGNHEPGTDGRVTFPGTMPEVITVGALDARGRVAGFSNVGAPGSGKPDLVAPGVLLSTFPTARDNADSAADGYVALGGTSMAAPMVAGTVALLMEADPSLARLSPTQDLSRNTQTVRAVLTGTARAVTGGDATDAGAGSLYVAGAVGRVDDGTGPVNWDALALLACLLALVGLMVYLRRRRARQRARLRARAASIRAGGTPLFLETGDGLAPTHMVAEADGPRGLPDRPDWQVPPWERAEP